jgi:bifunctional UDP-N-acetylglucosamine pyrophosphorylase/glucosamine-1-phosphate N-acetyltransferase
MTDGPVLVVVLAAGRGVRMQSDLPKVLHPIGGRSMLGHVLAAASVLNAGSTALVLAPGMPTVREDLSPGTS